MDKFHYQVATDGARGGHRVFAVLGLWWKIVAEVLQGVIETVRLIVSPTRSTGITTFKKTSDISAVTNTRTKTQSRTSIISKTPSKKITRSKIIDNKYNNITTSTKK